MRKSLAFITAGLFTISAAPAALAAAPTLDNDSNYTLALAGDILTFSQSGFTYNPDPWVTDGAVSVVTDERSIGSFYACDGAVTSPGVRSINNTGTMEGPDVASFGSVATNSLPLECIRFSNGGTTLVNVASATINLSWSQTLGYSDYATLWSNGFKYITFAELINANDDGAYTTGDYVAMTATHEYSFSLQGGSPTVSQQPTVSLSGSQITVTDATWSSGTTVVSTIVCQQPIASAVTTPTAGLSFQNCGPIYASSNSSDYTYASDIAASYVDGQSGRIPWVSQAGTNVLVKSCNASSGDCVATATVPYTASASPAAAPVPYSGPTLLMATGTIPAGAGEDVTIEGEKLETVTEVEVGKKEAEFSTTPTSLTLKVPTSLEIGTHDIDMTSSFGKITIQDAITVTKTATVISEDAVRVWTKLMEGDQVRLFAKNPVGAGKIQFFKDGKEIAWMNAIDETDPKLSFNSSAHYLVRTVDLTEGKNRFEIKVDGKRVWRATYVPKA